MTYPSFWFSQLADIPGREKLTNNLQVDVAIVGGGFTGLWTAYYLKKLDPNLSIALIEKEFIGFGASGRNGGWCSALFPTSLEKLAKVSNKQSAKNQYLAMVNTVNEIEQVLKVENIDTDWQRGGTVTLARSELQLQRARNEINHYREWGFDESFLKLLTREQTHDLMSASKIYGGTFTPHCAVINPAKLVRGLAQVVANLGVKIYEQSPAVGIEPHLVRGAGFNIEAKYIVRALEGYTSTIKGLKRNLIPVYSLMIATEPLTASVISQIGLKDRATFADFRNTIIYGQRTIDNRIAFGGRGAPYVYGSKLNPKLETHLNTGKDLEKTLKELLPQLKDVKITHKWGGVLGIPRDWSAHVLLNPTNGIASAGGYVGDGVGSSNLAGRTLADLILKRDSELTRLPWVNHHSKKWEIEPIRYIAINLGTMLAKISDQIEQGKSKRSFFSRLFNLLLNK